MKILYMGYFCNEEFFDQLVENGTKSSHARQQLEYKFLSSIIKGLKENDTLDLISYLPKIKGKLKKGEIWKRCYIKYAWCNKKNPCSVLKTIIQNMGRIIKWSIINRRENKIILIYSVNLLHAMPALCLRKYLNYKVVTLSSEVSLYRRKKKWQIISNVSRKIEQGLDNCFDGYIVLTKYMDEVINKNGMPSIVIEGIAGSIGTAEEDNVIKKKAILYAGGLSLDNGIIMLVEAFIRIENHEWELWICGDGELKGKILDYEKKHQNIKYFGVIPNIEVRKLEREAKLLINPRFSQNEYTKYSFPSKTIEYMESGTATIITRLLGIPEEYFEYVFTLEEESVDGLKCLLEYLFSLREEELFEKGKRAKEFVLKKKNITCQGEKITDFLRFVMGG